MAKKESLDKRVSELEEKKAAYAQAQEGLRNKLGEIEFMLSRAVDRDRMGSLSPEQRRQFLWNLIEVIVFDSGQRKAKIRGHIPAATEPLPQVARFNGGTAYSS